jgi:hypothetical protein
MRSRDFLILLTVLGCSTTEATSDDAADGGSSGAAEQGGQAMATGGSTVSTGGTGGSAGESSGGSPSGGAMSGTGGTTCVLTAGEDTCATGCCALRGSSYEIPEDLSCKRQTQEDYSLLECFPSQAGGGCGGGSALAWCLQRPQTDGWTVWYLPTRTFGWSPEDDWEDCSEDVDDARANAPECAP